jgi:hypothetical protein
MVALLAYGIFLVADEFPWNISISEPIPPFFLFEE